jgi:hypothetical protein
VDKKYLTRFFQDSKGEKAEIISDNEKPTIIEGEEFDLISIDEETIITLRFNILEIRACELIKMKFQFVEILDREEGTLDDDLEATNFLQKYIGKEFIYLIKLNERGDKIEITESCQVENPSFLVKILLKIYGLYYKVSQRNTYKEVVNEIEAK